MYYRQFFPIFGTINGYIYDSEVSALLGANVIIEGTNKGAISDENGFFEISKIKPQTYNFSWAMLDINQKNI